MKLLLTSLLVAASTPLLATDLHVSASAAPGGDGSADKPFATISDAQAAARLITDKPVTVLIGEGTYTMRDGMGFSAADSGTPERRVIYRAETGARPVLRSGVVIPPEALKPVTDEAILARLQESVRSKVREVDLRELEIMPKRFGETFRGLDLLEVYWDGNRQPLSRWPDTGFAKMETVLDNGIVDGKTGVFVYREEAPARWASALDEGLWLRGFWRVPWTIEGVRVASIDPAKRTITLAGRIGGGIGSKYHRAPNNGPGKGSGEEHWEAVNLIEEISQPGEWAVRFDDKKLYILPPAETGELLVSDVQTPVVSIANVSHFSMEGLRVKAGLGEGVSVQGGEDVLIAGNEVGRVAKTGILIRGGKNHTVLSNDVFETGLAGIDFLGGERTTLTPAGHRILNNIVKRAGLYFPIAAVVGGLGMRAESVGNYVAFNRIHDSSNSGVVYAGNDNVFEFNEIYRIGLGSNDLGCFYTTGGWTSRGNVVRFNFVHHSLNANAFYVDDGDSGDLFFGNVAFRTESGGFVGGGHDQIFKNNIIVESPRAMHVDSRGVPRGYTVDDKRLRGDLDAMPYKESPWKDKYPELVNILEISPEMPSGIVITDNLFVKCEMDLRKSGKPSELGRITFENNVSTDNMGVFVDPENLNFAIKPDADVLAKLPALTEIPFDKIGIYPDSYRPVVPPRDMELIKKGNTDRGFDSQTDIDASNRPAQ